MASQETDGHDSWRLRELEAENAKIEQGLQSAENAPVINVPDILPDIVMRWRDIVSDMENLGANPHATSDDV